MDGSNIENNNERKRCWCGGKLYIPMELGIRPDAVNMIDGWVWKARDVEYICSRCGLNIMKKRRSNVKR